MADEEKKHTEEEIDEEGADVIFEEEDGEGEMKSAATKLKELRAALRECQREKQEYLTGWQRARADYANYKREEDTRRERVAEASKEQLLLDVISVMDSFDMAFSNTEAWEQVDENWRKGIEHIYSQFQQVLAQYGVNDISTAGIPFDPAVHESVEVIETKDRAADGTVAKVIKRGYQRGDRVIRPAHVHVYEYGK